MRPRHRRLYLPFWKFRLTLMFLLLVAAIVLFLTACADPRPPQTVVPPTYALYARRDIGSITVIRDTIAHNICYVYSQSISCLWDLPSVEVGR